jgi:hypothetical protein
LRRALRRLGPGLLPIGQSGNDQTCEQRSVHAEQSIA